MTDAERIAFQVFARERIRRNNLDPIRYGLSEEEKAALKELAGAVLDPLVREDTWAWAKATELVARWEPERTWTMTDPALRMDSAAFAACVQPDRVVL